MASKWGICTNQSYGDKYQGGVITSNHRLSGDYPDIKFTYDVKAQWWSASGYPYSIQSSAVQFKYWATTYGWYTITQSVNFGSITGYSADYASTWFNEPMGDSEQISREIWLYVTNAYLPYETGACTVTSPNIEAPTNFTASLSSVGTNSCQVTYSFTNSRKYYGVRVWDTTTKTWLTDAIYGEDSGTITVPLTQDSHNPVIYIVHRGGKSSSHNIYKDLGTVNKKTAIFHYKKNGTWKEVKEVYMKRNNTWEKADSVYIKNNDAWKKQ